MDRYDNNININLDNIFATKSYILNKMQTISEADLN